MENKIRKNKIYKIERWKTKLRDGKQNKEEQNIQN